MPGDEDEAKPPQEQPAGEGEEAVAEAAQRPEDTPGAEPAQDSTEGAGEEQEGESDVGAQLAELLKDDPEMAKVLAEQLPQDVKDGFRGAEVDVAKADQETRVRERQMTANALRIQAAQDDEAQKKETAEWIAGLKKDVERGADDLVEGRSTNKSLLGDTEPLSKKMAEFSLQAQQSVYDRMVDAFDLQLREALEEHAVRGLLSPEQREKLQKLGKNPGGEQMFAWMRDTIYVYLDAAQASAPEEAKTRIREELDSDVERKERLGKAVALLRGNGRKTKPLPGGGPIGGKRYLDMSPEERDKLTDTQRDEIITADREREAAVSV